MTRDNATAVRVDFHNADADGFVRLNSAGAVDDLARSGIVLADGLRLPVTDGEVLVEGIVRLPGSEGVWRLEVDWADIFREHGLKK